MAYSGRGPEAISAQLAATNMPASLPNCKIELPSADSGDDQFGGTRTINQGYDFSVEAQIGEGTYGQVFMGNDKKSGDKVALKKIRMDTEKEGFPITAIREIKILSTLNDENVVNLREIVRSDINKNNNFKGSIYMVFDYAEFDLTGLMESQHYKFTEAQVKCIMKQLLKGLAYCHLNGVLHRDLKASNILIDARGIVKLADFGLARPYKDGGEGKFTNRVITLWYRPPELLLGAEKYGPEIDMWSVGCIFAELLCGKPIFPGKDEPDQLDKIFAMLGTPNEKDWPGISKLEGFKNVPKDKFRNNRLREWCQGHFARQQHKGDMSAALALLERFLQLDPSKRVSATEAVSDQWLWSDPYPVEPQDLPISSGSQHEFTMKKRRADDRTRADAEKAAAAHGQPDAKRGRYGPQGGQLQGAQGRGHQQQYNRPGGVPGAYGQPLMPQAGRGGGRGVAGGRSGAAPGRGGAYVPPHGASVMAPPPPIYAAPTATGYGGAAAVPLAPYGTPGGYPAPVYGSIPHASMGPPAHYPVPANPAGGYPRPPAPYQAGPPQQGRGVSGPQAGWHQQQAPQQQQQRR